MELSFKYILSNMTWQSKKIMYVYMIVTKAVHSSAFPALFYLTLVLSTILIRSTTWIYGGLVETGYMLTPS